MCQALGGGIVSLPVWLEEFNTTVYLSNTDLAPIVYYVLGMQRRQSMVPTFEEPTVQQES